MDPMEMTHDEHKTFMSKLVPEQVWVEFRRSWRALSAGVLSTAKDKGWNSLQDEGRSIALMHSELSEALDAYRHGNPPSEHIPEFSGVEEELADVVIRIMDHAVARGLNVAEAIMVKMDYNAGRRYKHGGKLF